MYDVTQGDPRRRNVRKPADWYVVIGMTFGLLIGGMVGWVGPSASSSATLPVVRSGRSRERRYGGSQPTGSAADGRPLTPLPRTPCRQGKCLAASRSTTGNLARRSKAKIPP
jgi:hypothetical protein